MGDDDDAEPVLGQAPDEIEHLAGLGDAEGRGGLVEDDELRVPHHRLRDGDRLPLAPGQAGDPLANRPERRDGEAVERLARGTLHRRLVEHEDVVHPLAAEEHVRDDVEVVGEREVLVDDLDPELGGVARTVDDDRRPVEPHLALVEGVDPDDALDRASTCRPRCRRRGP